MAPNLSLFSVNAILLLSTDDRSRILTKYYSPPHHHHHHQHNTQSGSKDHHHTSNSDDLNPYPTLKEQKAFEKGLLEKTNKGTGDIILYDGRVVCYKMEGDVMMYAVGGPEENEILLFGVVLALRDSLSILLKNSTDKRTLIENYDLVSLAIDEICDDGIILEVDPVIVASRVSRPPPQDVQLKGVDFSEQGVYNLLEIGKNKLAERMRQL
ncbi:MAG: Golgi-to-ER vesicle coat component [Ramalina farinacea]|uniref:Coatomer subunit zeta n=1 Tax=Ramalina farinacea TaxID=258253 RepID=A0AA43TZ35_9LECA|nr:Golgi-to-ER vesicle coat component [Ramalina farinacea]